MHTFRYLSFVAVLCIAIGCGGSSGTSAAPITTGNAQTMAEEGVGAVEFLGEMGGLVQGFSGVFEGNQVIPCDSGNVNVVINDLAPQGTLSSGDSATFTFNACVIDLGGESVTLNGSFSFSANTVSGTPGVGAFTVNLTSTFNGLTIVSSQGTVAVNGGVTVELSSADGVTMVMSVSGSYLNAFASGGGEAFSGTLANFSFENTLDESTGVYTATLMATVSGSAIGGTVTYETVVPFTGTDPEDPSSGSLVVTGANGATITLMALDNVNVEILVDLDGDGMTDATINTTWDVIDPDPMP